MIDTTYFDLKFKLTKNSSDYNDLKEYVKDLLNALKSYNKPSLDIQAERKKIREYIDDYERCNIQMADSYDGNQGGFNNGLKKNNIYDREINKLDLQEKLFQLVEKNYQIDKDHKETNDKAKDLILACTGSRNAISEVLINYYINGYTTEYLSIKLNIAKETINAYRKRGISKMAKMLL